MSRASIWLQIQLRRRDARVFSCKSDWYHERLRLFRILHPGCHIHAHMIVFDSRAPANGNKLPSCDDILNGIRGCVRERRKKKKGEGDSQEEYIQAEWKTRWSEILPPRFYVCAIVAYLHPNSCCTCWFGRMLSRMTVFFSFYFFAFLYFLVGM